MGFLTLLSKSNNGQILHPPSVEKVAIKSKVTLLLEELREEIRLKEFRV